MFLKKKLIFFIALLFAVTGGITYLFNTLNVNAENDSKSVKEDSSFTNIEVTSNNADVVIVPTKNSYATVKYINDNKKAKYIFDVDVDEDTLTVLLEQKKRFFFSFGFHWGDLELEISLPERQYKNLQVMSDNGRINMQDIQSDEVLLETDNGSIQVSNVKAKTIHVGTDNGKIILDQIQGEIKGNTDNGYISLTTTNREWPIDLSTNNGRIEIEMESEPTNATIDAKTENGKVSIFGEETNLQTYGKGKHLIKLRTDNGRITVTK
jgi:DUF4097 and DUF4098 domain-containing protein YvlB